jgi:hypothetical protein
MKIRLAVLLIGISTLLGTASAVLAAEPDTEVAQLQLQQALIPGLHAQLCLATGLPAAAVTVAIQAHQISVRVSNEDLNRKSPQVRETNASVMASLVEKSIKSKAEHSKVEAVHINFVGITGSTSKLVQGVDFYKSSSGSFVMHKT